MTGILRAARDWSHMREAHLGRSAAVGGGGRAARGGGAKRGSGAALPGGGPGRPAGRPLPAFLGGLGSLLSPPLPPPRRLGRLHERQLSHSVRDDYTLSCTHVLLAC